MSGRDMLISGRLRVNKSLRCRRNGIKGREHASERVEPAHDHVISSLT